MRPKKPERYKVSKECLYDLYIVQHLTRKAIAQKLGVSEGLIKYYMQHYGIDARKRNDYTRSESAIVATSTKQWRGHGEISLTYYNQIKSGAVRHSRTLEFSLTIEFLWSLFIKQERKCALSGLPLQFTPIGKGIYKSHLQTASLDRIDSGRGYTEDNVQWVHKDIQKMKMDLSEQRLKELCGLIYKKGL